MKDRNAAREVSVAGVMVAGSTIAQALSSVESESSSDDDAAAPHSTRKHSRGVSALGYQMTAGKDEVSHGGMASSRKGGTTAQQEALALSLLAADD